ncbi:Putative surface protein bspA-like (TvBspA-like-625) [Durusdinium trenchii]|uniref:Surface protein bspA-like (TvBspA-like-625) n=1 Tax=Durusdinium trenchii TaxID=1381693 RepID=A0ABP0QUB0_9DINO
MPPIPGALLRHWKVSAELGGSLNTDDWVHPMLRVVPMGWSWAMWLSQRVHQHQSQLGAGVSCDRVLVDGKPAPSLSNGEVLLLPYADVCGINAEAVQRAKDRAVARLRQVGLTVHEEMDANNTSQSLGYMIDGAVGQVTPIPERLHRVQLAFKWLSRRPRVTGRAVQRLLGHAVHFMMLRRELLSIPHHLYAFVQQANGRCRLWCSAAVEARWIGELLPLCATDLRKQTSALLTASDASLSGIAVCTRLADEQSVRTIGSYRERWRFKGRNPVNRPRQNALGVLDPFSDIASVKPVGHVMDDPFELDNQFPEVPKNLLENSQKNLDNALSAYLNEMFEDGEDIGEATKTLAAVVDSVPDCTQKGSLPRSRRCLQGWNRLDPGATRPPIPWELVAAIVNFMLGRQQINEGLLVLLMFDAYLRPGEAISLHRSDLVEPTVQHPVFCLNLNPSERGASSKMGLSDETIVLDGRETPWMGLLLRRHLESHKAQKLFPIEYRQLKDAWQKALVGLQLSSKHCVLYQLRHSGPSHDRMTKARSLVDIKKRGRWLSDSSVRRYEAAARLNQEFQKLPRSGLVVTPTSGAENRISLTGDPHDPGILEVIGQALCFSNNSSVLTILGLLADHRLAWAIAQLALSGLSFLLACYTACRKDPTAPVQLTAVVEFATEASPPPVSAAPVPAPSAEPPPEAAEASGADAPPPATAAAAAVAVAHGGTPMEPMWNTNQIIIMIQRIELAALQSKPMSEGLMLLLFSRAAWVLSFRRSLIRTIPGAPADQDVWRAVVNHQVTRSIESSMREEQNAGGRPAVHVQLLRMQANPGPAMAPMQPGMRPMEPGMRPMDPGMSPMDPGMSPMQLGMSPMQLGMSPMQPGMSHWGMPGPPPRRW